MSIETKRPPVVRVEQRPGGDVILSIAYANKE